MRTEELDSTKLKLKKMMKTIYGTGEVYDDSCKWFVPTLDMIEDYVAHEFFNRHNKKLFEQRLREHPEIYGCPEHPIKNIQTGNKLCGVRITFQRYDGSAVVDSIMVEFIFNSTMSREEVINFIKENKDELIHVADLNIIRYNRLFNSDVDPKDYIVTSIYMNPKKITFMQYNYLGNELVYGK